MTLVHLGLVALVALGQGARPAPAGPPGDLEGTAWRAVELAGAPVPSRPEPREPHLVFGAAGRLAGSDGCNHLTGSYAIKGEGISFGEIASTQMACPDSEDISRRFRGALKGTSHWRLAGARLEFYGATGKPLAVFVRRDTSPDTDLQSGLVARNYDGRPPLGQFTWFGVGRSFSSAVRRL